MKGRLVVSIHDVAPATAEASRRWVEILNSMHIRSSLLVVPGRWRGRDLKTTPSFVAWLKSAAADGHEIVLHGLEHSVTSSGSKSLLRDRMGRLMARGCQEFWNLDEAQAAHRIATGVEILHDFGFEPQGFVAPGWLMSDGTRVALRSSGLKYTCDHTRLIDLISGSSRRMLTTSQRPNSVLSTPGVLITDLIVAAHWRTDRSFRVALHPDDLGSSRLRDSNIRACRSALQHGFESNTYAQAWFSAFGRHGIRPGRR